MMLNFIFADNEKYNDYVYDLYDFIKNYKGSNHDWEGFIKFPKTNYMYANITKL